jgi:hypothetical protein
LRLIVPLIPIGALGVRGCSPRNSEGYGLSAVCLRQGYAEEARANPPDTGFANLKLPPLSNSALKTEVHLAIGTARFVLAIRWNGDPRRTAPRFLLP